MDMREKGVIIAIVSIMLLVAFIASMEIFSAEKKVIVEVFLGISFLWVCFVYFFTNESLFSRKKPPG